MPILEPRDIFKMSESLPVISSAALHIVSLIDNPSTSRDQIVSFVKADEIIFAECFKQANSVAIASLREYKTISEIVDILGFAHIKKVCLFLSAKSIIDNPKIWFESVFTAVAASYLAKKSRLSSMDCDKVYMAALFLNYGAYVLGNFYPALYAKATQLNDFRLRMNAEKAEFGITYPEVSALLLSKFGLPEYITDIIKSQKDIYTSGSSQENYLIELARVLCTIQDHDFESIRSRFDLQFIQDQVEKFKINLVDFDEESLEKIKIQTQEFSYRK